MSHRNRSALKKTSDANMTSVRVAAARQARKVDPPKRINKKKVSQRKRTSTSASSLLENIEFYDDFEETKNKELDMQLAEVYGHSKKHEAKKAEYFLVF